MNNNNYNNNNNCFQSIIESIKNAFPIGNSCFLLEDNYQEYSIFIPIIEHNDSYEILFEKRASNLLTQPNEICFPGGRIEENESPIDAAIRETSEELCISSDDITVLGKLPTLITPFGAVIHPYLGTLKKLPTKINHQEVSEVFTVPINFLLENPPIKHNVSLKVTAYDDFPYEYIETGNDYKWKTGTYSVYFYFFEKKIIWGITAKLLTELLKPCTPMHSVIE